MESELGKFGEKEVPNPKGGIGTRIAEVAAHFDSRKRAADAAGVSPSTLMRWISGESVPVFQQLGQLVSAAGYSLDWVFSGKGPKKLDGESGGFGHMILPGAMEDYAFVPLYDARCSAGAGSWNESSKVLTHLSFTKYSLRKQGLTPDHLSAIRIDGDSMEPVLNSGDTVLIDHTRTTIEGEGIYVLRLDGHLYAKRLQRNFDGVVIISENKHYQPVTVPRDRLDELEVIGRAVWAARWL